MNSFIASFALIGVCCLILNTSGIEAKESVPVLIWNDEKPPIDTPAISTLPVPFAHLQDKYLQPFKPDNILLFLQDTLSIEDLSSYEGVFKHVSKLMEKSHSLYLPAVEAKSSIAHSLSAHGNNIVTLAPGSSKGELKLKTDSKNLVLVKLPSTITNPSRRKALQKTDEIIGNVLSKIGKKAKFTVIFTGKEPSIKFENEIERRRVSRSLKQNEIDDPHFYHTTCVNFYLWSDMAIEDVNKTAVTLPVNDTIAKSDCQTNTASLTIRYKNVTDYGKLGVKFNFIKKRRSWTLQDAEFEITESDTKVFLLPEKQMYDVPLNKSYSCSQKLVFRSNSTVGKPVYKLIIKGVQVEAFTKGQWRFSNNWDCVGFFTIPIWMGIIAGVLLTFIFLVGMFMVSEIKTMDRFDDPKGKHIMVTGTNE